MPAFQSTSGQWSSVLDWPIIGIHCILTPDGKILTYGTDQLGQQGAQLIYDVWDIAANTHYTLPNTTPTDMFCSAAAVVPETGQILIMGGDARGHDPNHVNLGVHDANVYDPATMTVSALDPDCPVGTIEGDHICGGHMQFERWYPTAVTLANGKIVVLGGQDGNGVGVGTPELYTPFSGWRTLDGATSDVIKDDWWYPRAWLDADGKVNIFETNSTAVQPGKVMLMDPSGDGRITVVGALPFETSQANPAVMFEQNKVLALANNGDAWIMDMSGDAPTFTKTASLNESRLWSNMVVLADGSVLVSGGSGVYNELTDVTNEVAIWNPNTGQWKIGADAAIARLYHSTTILLPDATVLSLGGGAPGPLTNTNGEVYAPPYLFDQDGNLAMRPVISTAPGELKPGATFTISVEDALSIDRLTFIKYGAVTHSLNMAANKVELPFTVEPNNKLVVQLPENSNVLTPGDWMLFAINKDGTPSVASTVKIDIGGELLCQQMGGWVTLNGSAAHDVATDTFILTQDAPGQKGALMSNERIDLHSDFDINFRIYLGDKDAGADGMAFVLHNDPFGADATGGGGGLYGASDIRNGVAIGFDTYQNAPFGDIANDHTNFIKTDAPIDQARLSDQVDLGNIEDGNWHKVQVSWDVVQQTLSYSFDGKQAGTLTGDLASQYFAGFNDAYFGFTAATGGLSNLQQVEINKLDAVLEDGTQVHFNKPSLIIPGMGGGVTLNGNAHYDVATDTFILTQDAPGQKGALMSNERIDLHSDFDINFRIYLGDKDAGADGMAFVLHNDPFGADATGGGGGLYGASDIRNGVAIGFDTYQNAPFGDIANDHTNFIKTDAPIDQARLSDQVDLGNIEDGNWHKVQVSWDVVQQTLSYSFDGKQAGTLTGDLASQYFAGFNDAYFGFTAATGGLSNLQQVEINKLDAVLEDGTQVHFNKPSLIIPGMGGGVTLNGNAHYDVATDTFILTQDAPGQKGALMSNERIDLHSDFDINFRIYLGDKDAGADGMAFVLHNDPFGADATGGGGGLYGASGIRNGVAIGFDTYQNAPFGDIANDHTNFIKTDAPIDQARLSDQVDLGNIEDGNWHKVQVSWDVVQQTLSYSFDGKQAGTLTGDLASQYFAGFNDAYFGFTAATGGLSNLQQVEINKLDAVLEDGTQVHFNKPSLIIPGMGGGVTLNGNAHYDVATDTFILTQDAPGQKGALMSNERIDLHSDFDINFRIYLGDKDAGADGMAFVLHNDPFGADATGGGGGLYGASDIRNGVAIGFDTYQNAPFGDIANDHTNFIKTDAPIDQARLSDQVDLGNIEDGNWHKVQVSWDVVQQTLSYSFDGKQAGTLTGDLASQYFAGFNDAYFGFTAATGGLSNLQQVEINKLDAVLEDGTQVHFNKPSLIIPGMGGGVTLNGNAHYDVATDTFILTQDAPGQKGALMSNERIDLHSDFDINFRIYLGDKDAGADGMAFVLHNDPFGADATGGGGGLYGASGIRNGVAIGFDTYQNAPFGDIANDHTNFIKTDAPIDQARLSDQVDLGNIEDGNWHKVQVSWDVVQQTLSYSFDGKQAGTLTGDLASQYFAGFNDAYFGFTAATGGLSNLQQVEITGLDAILAGGSHVLFGDFLHT